MSSAFGYFELYKNVCDIANSYFLLYCHTLIINPLVWFVVQIVLPFTAPVSNESDVSHFH